jgi:hypothetical protein
MYRLFAYLSPVRTKRPGHHRRMRAIQNDESVDRFRVFDGRDPRHRAAPVVANDVGALRVERVHERHDVVREDL